MDDRSTYKRICAVVLYCAGFGLAACSMTEEVRESSLPRKRALNTDVTPNLRCLAEAIHGEARGESDEGKVFVGRVIMTRMKDGYGKSYCDVVYAKRQFAPRTSINSEALRAAKKSEELGPNGVTHFHSYKQKSTTKAGFSRSKNCRYKTKIGGHWGFYCQEARRTASRKD